jgi:hypothetical protein
MSDQFVTLKDFENYKKEADKKFGGKVKKVKGTREPNAYNIFMKEKVKELKSENSALTNQEAFKFGAQAWNVQKAEKAAAAAAAV